MAATATWQEAINQGGSPNIQSAPATIYFMSADAFSSLENANANPIRIQQAQTSHSYEKWLRVNFTGTFNSVSNMKFWRSAGTLNAGWSLFVNDNGGIKTSSWSAPVNSDSAIATASLATSEGAAHQVYASDGVQTALSTQGATAWIVLQADVAGGTSPGSMAATNITFTFQWDEQ